MMLVHCFFFAVNYIACICDGMVATSMLVLVIKSRLSVDEYFRLFVLGDILQSFVQITNTVNRSLIFYVLLQFSKQVVI